MDEIEKRDIIIEKLLDVLKLVRPKIDDDKCKVLIDGILNSTKDFLNEEVDGR